MKINSFIAMTLALALALTGTADAQRRRAFNTSGDYQSNGKFGLGLEVGDVFGVNGKLFLNPSGALDFGLGTVYADYYCNGCGNGLHLYLDYLWHPAMLTQTQGFKLPFYVGVGGRFWDFGGYGCDRFGNNCYGYSGYVFGVRVPVGISFDFNNVPLDIFLQVVPTLDFYHDYYNRNIHLDFDFTAGIRYWFS